MSAGGSILGDLAGKAAGAIGAGVEKMAGEAVAKESGQLVKRSLTTENRFFNTKPEAQMSRELIESWKQRTASLGTQMSQQLHGPAPKASKHAVIENRAGMIRGYSKAVAADQIFGQDFKALTTLVKISHQSNGQAYTEDLMDHIALALRDDESIDNAEHMSRFKQAARKEIGTLPQFKSGEEQLRGYKINSPYERPTPLENWVSNFVYSRLSPLIAIPHLGTAFNVVLATQNSSWTRALAESISGSTTQQLKDTLLKGGVMQEGVLRRMEESAKIQNGFITRYAPGSLQDILSKVTSTPFFGQLRDWQTTFAGSASYHDSIDYADQLGADNSNTLALRRLEQYGMKPSDISQIKQTGKLTQDQLERAVYNGTNRMIFFDTSFARTFNSQKNVYWRSVNMYHGYVSRQAQFLAEELKTQMFSDSGSILGAVKFMTTVGIVFPVAGEAIKFAEMAARGQFAQIGTELKDDYDSITFRKGTTEWEKTKNFLETYAQGMAHLGAFGIGWGLIQGAYRGSLAMQMLGPQYGTAVKFASDMAAIGKKGTLESAKPLGREALDLSLPYGIGRFIRHEVLPTKREAKERKHAVKLPKMGKIGGKGSKVKLKRLTPLG